MINDQIYRYHVQWLTNRQTTGNNDQQSSFCQRPPVLTDHPAATPHLKLQA